MEAALAAMWLGIGYLAGLFMAPSDAKRVRAETQAEIAALRRRIAALEALIPPQDRQGAE